MEPDLSWKTKTISPVTQQNYCVVLLRGDDPGPAPSPEGHETTNKIFSRLAGAALRAHRHDQPSFAAAAKELAAFLSDQERNGQKGIEQGANTPHDGIYNIAAITARLVAIESGEPELKRLAGVWLSGAIALYRELGGVFPGFRCQRAGVNRDPEAVLEAAARGVRPILKPTHNDPNIALTAMGCNVLMDLHDDFGGAGQLPRLLVAYRVTDGPGWQLVELDRVPDRPHNVFEPEYWTIRFLDARPSLWDKTGTDPIPAGFAATSASRVLGGQEWKGPPVGGTNPRVDPGVKPPAPPAPALDLQALGAAVDRLVLAHAQRAEQAAVVLELQGGHPTRALAELASVVEGFGIGAGQPQKAAQTQIVAALRSLASHAGAADPGPAHTPPPVPAGAPSAPEHPAPVHQPPAAPASGGPMATETPQAAAPAPQAPAAPANPVADIEQRLENIRLQLNAIGTLLQQQVTAVQALAAAAAPAPVNPFAGLFGAPAPVANPLASLLSGIAQPGAAGQANPLAGLLGMLLPALGGQPAGSGANPLGTLLQLALGALTAANITHQATATK